MKWQSLFSEKNKKKYQFVAWFVFRVVNDLILQGNYLMQKMFVYWAKKRNAVFLDCKEKLVKHIHVFAFVNYNKQLSIFTYVLVLNILNVHVYLI